jgi:ABC-type uncharacterized transport system ATPase subunit
LSETEHAVGPPLVEMERICKAFPGIQANDAVDLEVRKGEVHALLGQNGAGKTTLMNILSGLYRPDSGEIRIDGQPCSFRSPRDAIEAGIGMVHQHFKLVDVLSTAEHVALGLSDPRLRLDLRTVERKVIELGERHHLKVDPRLPVWQLSVGEQQRAEILKLLYRGVRILVMDEPTAVLTPQEAQALCRTLREIVGAGHAVVFISHKLQEVMDVADRITVLRAGRNVTTIYKTAADGRTLASLMMGRETRLEHSRTPSTPGEALLRVQDLDVEGDRGIMALRGFSLEVRKGEIVGLAGVSGNGQTELAEAIAGMRHIRSGSIWVGDEDVTNQPPEKIIDLGVSLIPEDRRRMGLVPSLSLFENAILKAYRRPPISKGPFLNAREIRNMGARLMERFSIQAARPDAPVARLSGGNLQRLLLAREFSSNPRAVVAAHPTRGLDIVATGDVRRLLLEQRDSGSAVLLISEDLEEILALSDRLAVIYEGRVMGIFDTGEASREDIGVLMAGKG